MALSMSSNKLSQLVLVLGLTTVLLVWSCQAKPHVNINEDYYVKAIEHIEFMVKHQCSKPKPRTIKVQDVHNEPDKKFSPNYVLLHLCDSQAGCCDNSSQVCSPRTTETVTKYFLVRKLPPLDTPNSIRHRRHHHNSQYQSFAAEPREFINHTSCYCKDI